MSLPPFTRQGVLPPGDYEMTIDELRSSHLVTGSKPRSPSWNSVWRERLVNNLEVLVGHLYRVELYPHFPGHLTGIRDRFGDELEFPSAFRLSRDDYRPKGIVRLIR